jgi:hypothetical protein
MRGVCQDAKWRRGEMMMMMPGVLFAFVLPTATPRTSDPAPREGDADLVPNHAGERRCVCVVWCGSQWMEQKRGIGWILKIDAKED